MDVFVYPSFNDSLNRDCRARAIIQFIQFIRRSCRSGEPPCRRQHNTRCAPSTGAFDISWTSILSNSPTQFDSSNARLDHCERNHWKEVYPIWPWRPYPTTNNSLDTPRRIPTTNRKIVNMTYPFLSCVPTLNRNPARHTRNHVDDSPLIPPRLLA